jgi:DNA invertase Pin-like site-specific DNA recombinase
MSNWWEIQQAGGGEPPLGVRAIAYYRHSAQDRQENSIPIQQDQVREWAAKNGVHIIHEFSDAGKSGLNAEGRPAFTEMMEEWVKKRADFDYVLCLDVSRWGRFQDIDLSAQFSAECRRHRKQIIYTTIGKPREDDPLYPVYVQFERFRAAQYSRELSDKVWRGCCKIAEQGYWAGGPPPYATQRLLLDEKREPLHALEPGQRKGIQNQRVTLISGDADEVAVIKRIFHEFINEGFSEYLIAERLNNDGIPSPAGKQWRAVSVLSRLRNETYTGTILYNRTSKKLKTPMRHNPPEIWVKTPDSFEGLISVDEFLTAQAILEKRRRKYDSTVMISQLGDLYERFGFLRPSLIRAESEMPVPSAYHRHFGSLDAAFQKIYSEECDRARQSVQDQITSTFPDVLPYSDFIVLDRRLTISIQPAVPVPHGYDQYWPIRPDPRSVIDMTLGVLLSEQANSQILGYVALPRLLVGAETLRLSSTSLRIELFGRGDLNFLKQLL